LTRSSVEEYRRLLFANALESITLPDATMPSLGPVARNLPSVFEDVCLLGIARHPQYLQLEYLHMIFAVELTVKLPGDGTRSGWMWVLCRGASSSYH
jgi:hypothetical protein